MRSTKKKVSPKAHYSPKGYDSDLCTLMNMPNELIALIATHLSQADLHCACLSNRRLLMVFEPILYSRDAAGEYSESLLWSAIQNRCGTAIKSISAGAKIDGAKTKPDPEDRIYWDENKDELDLIYGSRAIVPFAHCGQSSLFIAALQGHLEIVKILLTKGAAPNWKTPWENYMTPASAAAAKGHLDILEHLHKVGYALNDDRCYHGTVLHSAVHHGRAKVVEFLVKTAGIDISQKNRDGVTALAGSVLGNSVTVFRHLLKLTPAKDVSITAAFSKAIDRYVPSYAEIILDSNKLDWSQTTPFGDTLIAQTIQYDKPYFLYLLLERGEFDPNAPTASGLTPLLLARQSRAYLGTIMHTLLRSENICRADKFAIGSEVFFEFIRRPHCDSVLKLLLNEGFAGEDHVAHFHSAAEYGRHSIIRLLVQEFAVPVDSRLPNGYTALKAAYLRQDAQTTKCLCELGASSELRGLDHLPMLHHAARYGPVPLMRALLEGGVDINKAAEGTKQTALHFACTSGNLDRISALLEKGADPMLCDSDGLTAYHFAAREGKEKLMKWLLSGRRHPDPLLQDGPTLLHEACRAGNIPVMKLLLKRRCNLEARTSRGETALHVAVSQGHLSIMQLLLNCGADTSAEARDGSTPASLAAKSDSTEIRDALQREQSKSPILVNKVTGGGGKELSDTGTSKNAETRQLRRSSRVKSA